VAWLAITPPPPAWFSTMKFWPSALPQGAVTVRAMRSEPPPADTGTM
jgi:hypothetical protein